MATSVKLHPEHSTDTLTDVRLHECAAVWQQRLRLQDWDLKLSIVRVGDLGAGTLGDCDCHSVKRQARIRLLDPRDVEGQAFWFDGEAWNWHVTLVHELLHLHFHDLGLEWSGKESRPGERAIDAIAKALVVLDRERD